MNKKLNYILFFTVVLFGCFVNANTSKVVQKNCEKNDEPQLELSFKTPLDLVRFCHYLVKSPVMPWSETEACSEIVMNATLDLRSKGARSQFYTTGIMRNPKADEAFEFVFSKLDNPKDFPMYVETYVQSSLKKGALLEQAFVDILTAHSYALRRP